MCEVLQYKHIKRALQQHMINVKKSLYDIKKEVGTVSVPTILGSEHLNNLTYNEGTYNPSNCPPPSNGVHAMKAAAYQLASH